ncbi:MAG: hypothetical protein KatS3mg030_506 [Saprospiraceae bacterium]|nr:MAG: hypothetical protein KatS3mg030_506 [Saprospiraceae bacterium]
MPRHAIVAIYAHPEAYPPTLNALGELARHFEQVSVVYRPIMETHWRYPDNVTLLPSGAAMHVREQERLPVLEKVKLFAGYVRDLRRAIAKHRPELVLVYDALALFAWSLVRLTGPPAHKVWYHNHDVLHVPPGRLSLNWFASRAEKRVFKHLDVFSLPAEERKIYFPMERLRGRYAFLPNLPSAHGPWRSVQASPPADVFRLLYQGHIFEGHGFEQILSLMPFEVGGKPVELVLAGWITDEYRRKLEEMARSRRAEAFLKITGVLPYEELTRLTASCHVGLAVFNMDRHAMASSAGTASNKIYEYAAAGLPVLYFDDEHYRRHLGQYRWTAATDLSVSSLVEALQYMHDNWPEMSSAAKADFFEKLNFEAHFRPVYQHLLAGGLLKKSASRADSKASLPTEAPSQGPLNGR